MKFRVLNPIMQDDSMLFAGATIELNFKQSAELIACGAIAPEPIDQDVAVNVSSMSEANQGDAAGASVTSGDGQSNANQTADTDATPSLAAEGKKKPAADKAAT